MTHDERDEMGIDRGAEFSALVVVCCVLAGAGIVAVCAVVHFFQH